MEKYITNLYGQSDRSTAMIAQHMVTDIAKNEGYSEISLRAYRVDDDTETEKIKRIDGILSSISPNSLVIAQMPSWNGISFDEIFLKKLREQTEKLVVFVQDFVPLMFENNYYLFDRYLEAYNHADLVILPSEKMKQILVSKGLKSPVILQEIWDHVHSISLDTLPTFQRKIKFSGSSTRFPFIKEWKSELPLEVFSDGTVSTQGSVKMMGWRKDDQLLRELNKGGFGLVWSENIDNQAEREYSEMNTSFKFSTYLAAGIPIIVNKGIAKEFFVEKHKIGLAVETLDEAVETIKLISAKEYQELQQNVSKIAPLLKDGFFTKKLLINIEEQLFLKG
ncbi:sugar transferase [Enterococcus mundtii]|uniref:Glucosyltransferase 3 n=1 Tax=Enterococcus mundtii TaxID=53346 RepID=A0A242KW14_ENTMU|nr:sugar transferase [Enterococcus mundtii]OTP24832.1 hypothetical protein A5802_002987 [Enterococcus mundtii]